MATDAQERRSAYNKNLGSQKRMSGKLLRRPLAPVTGPTLPPIETTRGSPDFSYFDQDFSPVPSGAPSLASLAPSDHDARSKSYYNEFVSPPSTRKARRLRLEGALVLDPLQRQRTNVGTFVEGHSLVKPYKHRGPDALPARPPKQRPYFLHDYYLDEDFMRYYEPPAFTLQDFLYAVSNKHKLPLKCVKDVMLSRHNYKKIQKILTEEILHQRNVSLSTVNINKENEENIPKVSPRVPQSQLLLEMASLVKQQFTGVTEGHIKSLIRPLPKYSPGQELGAGPHTEIVLYEDNIQDRMQKLLRLKNATEQPGTEAILQSSGPRFFQDSKRSTSPFTMQEEGQISPEELAMLDALVSGGTALSLKAHFISALPDIDPLRTTITYLNLSFNDFHEIPEEIFDLGQLTVLKLRNNPLHEIPQAICQLQNLRTLVISFCLVATIPMSLFTLRKLDHMDLSFNRITFLPNELSQLSVLHSLNMEGNQLPAMPCAALKLRNLEFLRVQNNFMHPVFWADHTKHNTQTLLDLSALAFVKHGLIERHTNVPDNLRKILSSHSVCDCCGGPRFGTGLRRIRPVSKIFGIKNLPFLFQSCSPGCATNFMNSTDTLLEMLYGTDTET